MLQTIIMKNLSINKNYCVNCTRNDSSMEAAWWSVQGSLMSRISSVSLCFEFRQAAIQGHAPGTAKDFELNRRFIGGCWETSWDDDLIGNRVQLTHQKLHPFTCGSDSRLCVCVCGVEKNPWTRNLFYEQLFNEVSMVLNYADDKMRLCL